MLSNLTNNAVVMTHMGKYEQTWKYANSIAHHRTPVRCLNAFPNTLCYKEAFKTIFINWIFHLEWNHQVKNILHFFHQRD